MSQLFVKNRSGLNVRVCIDTPEGETDSSLVVTVKGLAFIMPGLGSHHRKPEFRAMSEILTHHGYVVVSLDPTHSFGESEGDYADATFTTYATDLEDVIEWAGKNLNSHMLGDHAGFHVLYTEPFILVGHSLGAMSVAYYAERFPEKVKALAPLATVISGKLSLETRTPEELEKWKTLGYQETVRSNGDTKTLKWSHMEDRLKYDLLKDAAKITMPLLMLAGELDKNTPPKHQQLFFDAVGTKAGEKEFHIIKNADHNIGRADVLPEVKEIFEKWIEKLGK